MNKRDDKFDPGLLSQVAKHVEVLIEENGLCLDMDGRARLIALIYLFLLERG